MKPDPSDPFYDYGGRRPRDVHQDAGAVTIYNRSSDPGFSDARDADLPPDVTPPIDDNQQAGHPFAISVRITGYGGSLGEWTTAEVKVKSGSYDTHGGSGPYDADGEAYPGDAHSSTVTRDALTGTYTGNIFLIIPVEADDDNGIPSANTPRPVKAISGGEIRLSASAPERNIWPNVYRTAGGTFATAVLVGTWTVREYSETPGVSTPELRVQIDQKITDNITLGVPDNGTAIPPVPAGETKNDILYWDDDSANDGEDAKWVTLAAPTPTEDKTWVLGIVNGTMQWIEAEDCEA